MTPFEAGKPSSKLCLLGEAPAANEMRKGEPFVGDAGAVLDRCLVAAGVERRNVYILNVFEGMLRKNDARDRAWLGDDLVWTSTKGLTPRGLECAAGMFGRLRASGANCAAPLGGVAFSALFASLKGQIGKWRGSILEWEGRKIVPTYHPATVCWGSTHLQHVIATDLRRAKEQSEFPEVRRRPRDLILNPSHTKARGFLQELRYERKRTFFDLELYNGQLSAISLSNDPEVAISIPFLGPEGHRWTAYEERVLLDTFAELLYDPEVPKGNQNVTFDLHILAELYGMVGRGVFDDPMVLHSIVFPDMEKGLAYQTSWLTDVPYYKDDGGKRAWQNPWANLEAFWRYSALDACVSLECFEALERDYLQSGSPYEKKYRGTMELVEPLAFMMLRGQRVDAAGLETAKKLELTVIEALRSELDTLHPGFNPASSLQCAKLLYSTLGHKPYLSKQGKPTTDVYALRRLARKGATEAGLLLRLRSAKKRLDELSVQLRNGRLHTAYNIRGTKTGRLSSEEDEFGTGGNVQNRTAAFKTFLVSDEESV